MSICYVCNKAVDDKAKHECEQAKRLIANPVILETYIHGNAMPSRRYGGVDYSPRGTV